MKIKNLLAVILILAAAGSAAAQEAHFAEITGTVEVKVSGDWKTAAAGDLIEKSAVISTGIKSSAVISVGASTVSVSPLTILTLEELVQQDGSEEAILYLRTGRVKADVTPPSGMKAEFTVRSPTTTASVRGTSFTFNGRRLAVHSGRVAFANNLGQKVYVNGNQKSYAETGHHQRLALPSETESAGMKPALSEDNSGSGKSKIKKQTAETSVIVDWI